MVDRIYVYFITLPLVSYLKFILFGFRVAVKREAAVSKEMNAKLADDKKISRKEKDERILWKKNEVHINDYSMIK